MNRKINSIDFLSKPEIDSLLAYVMLGFLIFSQTLVLRENVETV